MAMAGKAFHELEVYVLAELGPRLNAYLRSIGPVGSTPSDAAEYADHK